MWMKVMLEQDYNDDHTGIFFNNNQLITILECASLESHTHPLCGWLIPR